MSDQKSIFDASVPDSVEETPLMQTEKIKFMSQFIRPPSGHASTQKKKEEEKKEKKEPLGMKFTVNLI